MTSPQELVGTKDPTVTAALDDVVAARAALGEEFVHLEATARAAVDIRAKVKRNPGRTAAAVGTTAFVVLGGPRRVFRSVKHRIVGKPDPLPPSLLPDQVEKAIQALGDDGAKVRGSLEREFAAFVDTNRKGDRRFLRRLILTAAVPFTAQLSRELMKRLFEGSPEEIERREVDIRARTDGKGAPPTG